MEDILATSVLLEYKWIITGVVMAISSYFLLRRDPRIKYYMNKLGGPSDLPVLGNALQLLIPHNQIIPVLGKWIREYGLTYRIWIGNLVPYAVTCDVKLIEKMMSSSSNHLDKGKYDYSLLMDWLGTGLLTAPAKKWSSRRKMITPSFHFRILEDFLPVFNEQANVMLECLERDERDKIGKIFNMYPYINKCTLDIICETAMGKKINAQTSTLNKEYMDAVNGMCALLLDKNLKPWLRVPLIYKLSSISTKEKHCLRILKGFTEQVIQARKLERSQTKKTDDSRLESESTTENSGIYGKQRQAFLDLLLDTADESGSLTDADIREEVDTFMFEGHDTTSVSLGWTVLLIAMHPECQKRLQDELDEIFADNPTRDVTTADIAKMKYLESCVKESLRLFPSVPFVMRQLYTDVTLDVKSYDILCPDHDKNDGKIIPKGATVFMGICFLHRLAEHFPEPSKFIPERFSLETTLSTKRHPYAYIPFSAGPRNCIGQKFAQMEEKIILAKLFRRFTIETEETMETLIPLPDVVLRSETGVHVRLRKRL